MAENSYLIAFIVFILLLIISLVVAAHILNNTDPHSNDSDYCQQYARGLNWRMTANYLANPAVADQVCSCTYTTNPNFTRNGVEQRPMYPGQYVCERK